jgi:hypothetical protein
VTPDNAAQGQDAFPGAEREMIDEVYRRLVRIHAAIAERTNEEALEIMPWTMHELMALIREVGAFRRECRGTEDVAAQQAATGKVRS